MRIFLSGATGVLGRRVVPLLIDAGHQVVAHSRSDEKSSQLAARGAEPVRGDLFSTGAMREAASGCEAILHLATAIPARPRTTLADWALNDRIRTEGTRTLLDAAAHNRCRFFLQQSVTFLYGDRGGAWVDEETPLPAVLSPVVRSAVEMESIVKAAGEKGLPAAILRFGSFYCHDSAQTRAMFEMAGKGRFPVIGSGHAFWNLLHVDDAARAVAAAIDSAGRCAGGTFNVCDDEPVTYEELAAFVAEQLGAGKPMKIPAFLAKLLLGSHAIDVILASARCRNGRFKDVSGWNPDYPTFRQGIPAELEKWKSRAG